MNPSLTKLPRAKLRQQFRQRRTTIAAQVRTEAVMSITRHLTKHFNQPDKPGTAILVGAYMATREEVDLGAFLTQHLAHGGHAALPRVATGGVMTFHRYTATSRLVEGHYGIAEPGADAPMVKPTEIGAILVPMVAFDRNGTRLGMGGGYYDRYIPRLATTTNVIGVAFACQQSSELLPHEHWDMPLHAVVTENGVLEFS